MDEFGTKHRNSIEDVPYASICAQLASIAPLRGDSTASVLDHEKAISNLVAD